MKEGYRGRHLFQLIIDHVGGAEIVDRGDIYYVDVTNGSDSNSGKHRDFPVASIEQALSLAGDYDTIIVGAGDYEEENLTITQRGLHLLGDVNENIGRKTPLLIGDDDYPIITVAAHDVEIAGLGFVQTTAYPIIYVGVTAAIWRTTIKDCYFDGYGTATYLVQLGASSGAGEAVGAEIKHCKFYSIGTAGVYNNSENTTIEDCLFNIGTAKVGILDVPNGGNRPDRWYLNNKFMTTDSTNAVGISFSNTPTKGTVCIAGSRFVNFADKTKCSTLRSGYLAGDNYDDNALLTDD